MGTDTPHFTNQRAAITDRGRAIADDRHRVGISRSKWNVIRARVLLRDCYGCQTCGYDGRRDTYGLHVHHITPRVYWGLSDDDLRRIGFDPDILGERDDEGNLITLCRDCHGRATAVESQILSRVGIIRDPAGAYCLNRDLKHDS